MLEETAICIMEGLEQLGGFASLPKFSSDVCILRTEASNCRKQNIF